MLHDLLLLRIESGDNVLKNNFEAKKNAKYTSPTIQNELICLSGDVLQSFIIEDIKKCAAYSFLADETADLSGKEQLSIGVRFFDQSKSLIREEFVGFVVLTGMDAESIAASIKAFAVKMDLDPKKCVGLGFDGCATMAGKTGGVQQILKEYFPNSLYFHCASHRLNLVVNDLNAVAEIRNTISTIRDIINFFKESVIRRKYVPNIHSFCETRWSEKYASISDFKKNFLEIMSGLEKLSTEGNASTRKSAFQLHSAACKSTFIISLCIISKYYALIEPAANILQSKNMDIIKCADHIRQMLDILQAHRSIVDVEFNNLFLDATKIANELSIELTVPRVVEKQKNRSNPPFTSTSILLSASDIYTIYRLFNYFD